MVMLSRSCEVMILEPEESGVYFRGIISWIHAMYSRCGGFKLRSGFTFSLNPCHQTYSTVDQRIKEKEKGFFAWLHKA